MSLINPYGLLSFECVKTAMFKKRHFGFIFLAVSLFLSCISGVDTDVTNQEPAANLSAEELIFELQKDEGFYSEEVVRVTGYLVETNTKNNKFNILIRSSTNQDHYIICEMGKFFEIPVNGFQNNQSISVKGVLKGYLNDAVLLNCVLDNRFENE